MSNTDTGGSAPVQKLVIEDRLFRIVSIQAREDDATAFSGTHPPKTRLVLQNADFTGLAAVDWNHALTFNESDVVKVSGKLKEYKGQPQLTITAIEVVEDFEPSALLPCYGSDLDQLESRLESLITGIDDPRLREIASALLDPASDTGKRFRLAPGSIHPLGHEPYIHGLMHHLVETAELATSMATQFQRMRPADYGKLNASRVTFGALLHDIGKTVAYSFGDSGFKMSRHGKLNGHLVQSCVLVDNALRASGGFGQEEIAEILHMFVSHHGPESDQPPLTMEALIVHKADNICSDMGAKFGNPNAP